jgi:phosphomannomutase
VYFANARYGFGGSVMITASHNPPEYNGLKISGRGAVPVDGFTGLQQLREMVKTAPRPQGARGGLRFGADRYFSSGELSFAVANREKIIAKVRRAYQGGSLSEISGLRIDFADWWFVLRAGSTEPRLRLVIEASTKNELNKRTAELTAVLREFSD